MMKNWQGSTFFRKFSFHFSAIVWIIFGNCSIVHWKALSVTCKVQKTITFQIKYPFVDLIFISFHLKLLKVYLNRYEPENHLESFKTHTLTGQEVYIQSQSWGICLPTSLVCTIGLGSMFTLLNLGIWIC